jgi:hypothetical protein
MVDRIFFLRYEGLWMLQSLLNKIDFTPSSHGRVELERLLDDFLQDLVRQLQRSIVVVEPELRISVYQLEEIARQKILLYGNFPVVTMDSCCTHPGALILGVSRLFDVQGQKKICVGARPGYRTIEWQMCRIARKYGSGPIILDDDDIWTGSTVDHIRMVMKSYGIKVEKVVAGICVQGNDQAIEAIAPIRVSRESAFDIADPRDFLIGSREGGLALLLGDGRTARAPYFQPFTDPAVNAGIPDPGKVSFSLAMLELNYRFYQSLGVLARTPIRLKHLWSEFVNYATHTQGVSSDLPILDYIESLYSRLA